MLSDTLQGEYNELKTITCDTEKYRSKKSNL